MVISSGPAAASGFSHASHLPFSRAFVGDALALEIDRHGLAGVGRPPDADRHALLQDHVVGDQGGQFDRALQARRRASATR